MQLLNINVVVKLFRKYITSVIFTNIFTTHTAYIYSIIHLFNKQELFVLLDDAMNILSHASINSREIKKSGYLMSHD